MRVYNLDRDGASKIELLVFAKGEEVMERLRQYAADEGIAAASFTGIGAFSSSTVAFFDRARRVYDPIPVDEQVELLNITGNITLFEGAPRIHAHATLSRPDGSTIGGHLIAGTVWPTLELTLWRGTAEIVRETDEESGLGLVGSE